MLKSMTDINSSISQAKYMVRSNGMPFAQAEQEVVDVTEQPDFYE